MNDYWPWWLGALALGLITSGYAIWTRHGLGVSGAWSRVLTWRASREVDRMDAQLDVIDLREVLAAATVDQFGAAHRASVAIGPTPEPAHVAPQHAASGFSERGTSQRIETVSRPLPSLFSATLLGSIFVGGLIASLTSGRFEVRGDMGAGYSRIVTDDPVWMAGLLLVGGIMVGFGTRMAGGCTSGHGLTGCSRLQPVSLVATAAFFGAAVVVSFLLWKVI